MPVSSGLVDAYGRPVKVSRLQKEVATVSMASVRSPWFTSEANTLDPERLAAIIYQVDQNDIDAYLTLAEEMEERDLHYRSVLGTRKMAVSGLETMVEAVTDDARDVEIADFVRDQMEKDAVDDLTKGILDGVGKGFSVVEINWDRGSVWTPCEYTWVDGRHFQFDRETGRELRMKEEGTINGVELDPYKFVIHRPKLKMGLTIRAGLARLAVVAYMCKSYALKDWLAFVETYGMPIRVGRYDGTATSEQKATLLNAVARIGIDAACIIPANMEIDFVESGGGKAANNDALFLNLVEYLDSQTSKGVLGQTMTTDDGSSQSQANVHNDVRGDILRDDAKQASATIRRDVIKPLVDLNFPGPHEKYPRFRYVVEEPEDLVALTTAVVPLVKLGLRVEQSVFRDKFGFEEPEEGAEILAAPVATPPDDDDEDDDDDDKKGGVDDTPAPEPDAAPDSTRELRKKRDDVVTSLLSRIHRGEEITPAQEHLVEMALLQQGANTDTIDRIARRELSKWEEVMDPVLDPILALAKHSGGFQDFVDGLDEVVKDMNSSELVKSMALSMFKSRGLGDGTDKP